MRAGGLPRGRDASITYNHHRDTCFMQKVKTACKLRAIAHKVASNDMQALDI